MNFKKYFLTFINLILFLSGCGLEINEKAPSLPIHREVLVTKQCADIDYKKEFQSYFFSTNLDDGESSDFSYSPESKSLSQVIYCMSLFVQNVKNKIRNESLNKEQLLNVLSQDIFQEPGIKPLIDHITTPAYFDDYLFFKSNVVYIMQQSLAEQSIDSDRVCNKRSADQVVFFKKEINTFIAFLETLYHFFLQFEKDSETFVHFFKHHGLTLKSQLQNPTSFAYPLAHFLSAHFSDEFPAYSKFLKDNFEDRDKTIGSSTNNKNNGSKNILLETNGEWAGNDISDQQKQILQPMLDMAMLPVSSSDSLSEKNIRYMLLNIYLMKTFFSIYDINKDFVLERKELSALSCLITPLLSIALQIKLKDRPDWLELVYSPENIINYVFSHQTLPEQEGLDTQYLLFAFLSVVAPRSIEPIFISYTEISRIISLLFLNFFYNDDTGNDILSNSQSRITF